MRTVLLLVLAALVLAAAWWLARPAGRKPRTLAATSLDASASPEAELQAPAVFAGEPEDVTAESGTSPPRAPRTKVSTTKGADRAPIRGRLVLAGTSHPIEAEFPVRLRTADLELGESVTTLSDGTFTSTQAFPRSVVLARVRNERGIELVDHEGPFDPLSDAEWLVPVPARKGLVQVSGRVVDPRGRALTAVVVQLVPRDLGAPYLEAWTDEEGRFGIDGPAPGVHRLLLQGRWTRSEPQEIRVRAAQNELGDVVLAQPPGTGDLVVRTWHAPSADFVYAEFLLRDEHTGRELRFGTGGGEDTTAGPDGSQLVNTVRIAELPAGSYRLTVHSNDGRAYEPKEARISPPATVDIRVQGELSAWVPIRVLDARTGQLISDAYVLTRVHGVWGKASAWRMTLKGLQPVLLHPGTERWIAMAQDRRPVTGTLAGSSADGIDVALEPGWSLALRFEDVEGARSFGADRWRMALLPGVEVSVDGRPAAESDADGFLLLDLDKAPGKVEYRLPGWSVLGEDRGPPRVVRMVRTR